MNYEQFKGYEGRQQAPLISERSMHEQVEQANRAKDEFFAVLSHELKNPLNLIHVKAKLLARSPETRDLDTVQDAASAILRSVTSHAKIIDDLLHMSRARTGKLTLSYAPTDLAG